MLDIDGFEVIWRICVDGCFVGLLILVMIVNVLLVDCEVCLVVGMNDYVVKLIDKECLVFCLFGYFGRSGVRGVLVMVVDVGELVEVWGDIVGCFGGSLELIV